MIKKVTLFILVCGLGLAAAACGEAPQPAAESTPAPPPKKEEPPPTIYELTKDDLMDKADWTSRNVSVLGVKIGDITRNAEKSLGELENTRTGAEDYIGAYQNGGVVVHTFKLTGKARKIEITGLFAAKIKDEKIKRLLSSGDLKLMRELFGQETETEEIPDDNATEYAYDARGFRVVKYKVGSRTITAIRFVELRRSTT